MDKQVKVTLYNSKTRSTRGESEIACFVLTSERVVCVMQRWSWSRPIHGAGRASWVSPLDSVPSKVQQKTSGMFW